MEPWKIRTIIGTFFVVAAAFALAGGILGWNVTSQQQHPAIRFIAGPGFGAVIGLFALTIVLSIFRMLSYVYRFFSRKPPFDLPEGRLGQIRPSLQWGTRHEDQNEPPN